MSNIEHFAMRTYEDGTFAIEFPHEKELESENAELRELVRDFDKCLDTILGLTGCKGFVILPDQELFDSLTVRMHELGVDE